MQFRCADFGAAAARQTPESTSACQDVNAGPSQVPKREKATLKVVQSEFTHGFLVEDVGTGRFLFVQIPLTAPLQIADRSTAKVLKHLMDEQ
eukprot:668458-Heterocapsa_arctica.AAC.1